MPTEESLKETLEHFKNQERKLLEQVRSVRMTIASLQRELGIEGSTEPEIGFDEPDDDADAPNLRTPAPTGGSFIGGGKQTIRPDEFFGMTQAEAARRYLKRVGHAVSFDELVEALQKGGCKVGGGGTEPKRVLYISLIRNTRDFVPPQQGFVGLREFYPNLPKASAFPKTKTPKKRSGRRTFRATKVSNESGKVE